MRSGYKILLYNAGKRIKSLGKAKIYSDCIKIYDNLLKGNKIFFPKYYNWLGKETDYELVLIGPKSGTSIKHFRNDLGALVKVKASGDFVVKKIQPYGIEEQFKHKNSNITFDFKGLVKNFLASNETKVIISINNKLVIEYFENENRDDSQRLNKTIKDFSYSNGLTNFIFFNDPAKDAIKRIYDLLEENYGIDRVWMSRVSTR
jgi:hypothetical protein